MKEITEAQAQLAAFALFHEASRLDQLARSIVDTRNSYAKANVNWAKLDAERAGFVKRADDMRALAAHLTS